MKYNRDELEDKIEREIRNKIEEGNYKANLIQIENENNMNLKHLENKSKEDLMKINIKNKKIELERETKINNLKLKIIL